MTPGKEIYKDKYKLRKLWFWVFFILISMVVIVSFFLYSKNRDKLSGKIILVGICGEIKHAAVYSIQEGSDLSQLIRKADGLTINADIGKCDLSLVVLNDSIYHIPAKTGKRSLKMNAALSESITQHYSKKPDSTGFLDKEIKHITILYVGFPAVYMLINYYPDQKRVSIVHIPHSTILMNSDYRLIDIFFTLGIEPTIRILENTLNQKIDYYLIQDRFSFIDLVNQLDGIDLSIDQPFAEHYHLKTGNNHLDGFYTWEYIRFIDIKRMNGRLNPGEGEDLSWNNNFKIAPKDLQLAYEMRQYRQRNVINALRHACALASSSDQLTIIKNVMKSFETNIGKNLVFSLYKDVLGTPKFSYATIPGYYSDIDDKLYYYPDIQGYKMLRNSEVRKYVNRNINQKTQVIY
jgi:anionic cell wall polymer biosynthesis LytR-Cps2A-Psr (LCP) family protein